MKIDATVDAAYYEARGKNVFALVDVSFYDGDIRRTIKRVPTGRIDVEGISPGDLIAILVNPAARDRCVVDS
ncbi:hypothetical protein OEG84_16555 [Hoeflea sp. G2-23]|uniref:Uncharacterized protein n=1 Tax=Hoeflea algicola TaxID=2983763 RepID=A0ABT3ZBX7_9HYPH|nr:hypothetical protein [Hoeflea algicola]MCY0149275.1 hypothetical protein [Hoeflea algicola]